MRSLPAEKIKPCHCGHEGRIDCVSNGWWLEAKCPTCQRQVTAFTSEGLIEAWNKPKPEQEP